MCTREYPDKLSASILTTDNTRIMTTIFSLQVNDQLMIRGDITSIALPNTINTFIINVSLSNNEVAVGDVSFLFSKCPIPLLHSYYIFLP